jgi:2'-5' RNA ligase
MKKFTKIKDDKKEFKYELGCVMMYFDVPNWKDIHKMIDKEDVYDEDGFGYENDSHITLLFGLLQGVEDKDVKEIVDGLPKMYIELSDIDIFQGTEYDVVKFNITNQMLNDINCNLCTLPNEQTHPEYHPHMTICYVKPGRGVKYIQKLDKTIVIKPTKIIYSKPDKNGNKIEVDLKVWN